MTLTGVSKKTLSSVTIMKEIKIGNTSYKVTTIGAKAFENCKKLKKIVISNTELKAIGKNAFKGISSKAVIKVPASKYKVYTKLLKIGSSPQKFKTFLVVIFFGMEYNVENPQGGLCHGMAGNYH